MSHSISRRGLSVGVLFAAIAQVLHPAPAQAQVMPSGGTPVAGVSGITTTDTTTTVDVTGPRALVNWDSFDVANGYTFEAIGPGNFLLVNRVTGGTQTTIDGLVRSSGNIWILNNAGIAVGGTGRFDVAGLLLSTSALTDADILDGNGSFDFSAPSGGLVLVRPGAQLTANGGSITLMGNAINVFGGTFDASGDITLLGANGAQVTFDNDLNAITALTVSSGSNQGTAVSLMGATGFSGARTIIAAAGMADYQGNILLVDDNAANDIRFLNGDVVLYAAHKTDFGPQQVISGGAVVDSLGSMALDRGARVQVLGDLFSPGNLWAYAAGGVGNGGNDLSLGANGTLAVNAAYGRDIALLSGGDMRLGRLAARDDLVIRSDGNVQAEQLVTGATVDGSGATDAFGAGDTLAAASLDGYDLDIVAGASSNVEMLLRPVVRGDYRISAGDFFGSATLNPDFGTGTTNAFSINDTAGGFSLGFSIVTPGNFSLRTVGQLTTFSPITSTNGSVSLYGGTGLRLNGNVSTGTGPGRSITLGTGVNGSIVQDGGVITTNALGAQTGGLLSLTQANLFATGAFSAGSALSVRSDVAGVTFTQASTTSGDVTLTAQNGMRLSDATVSTTGGNGSVALAGNVALTGSNTVAAVNGATFGGTVDGADGSARLAVTTGSGATFQGNVGAASALDSLTVNGASAFSGTTVRTSSGLTLNGDVTAGTGGTIAFDAGNGALATGNVTAANGSITGRGTSVTMGTVSAGGPVGIGTMDPPLRTIALTATDGNISLAGGSAYQTSLAATGSIEVTGALASSRLTGIAGGTATFGGDNRIWNLGDFSSTGFSLRNTRSLIVDGVVSAGGGDVRMEVVDENLQIDPAGRISGRDIALSSNSFYNQSGADALVASGKWVIYQQYPFVTDYQGLDSGAHAIWGQTIDTLAPSAVTGNRYVFAFRPTLTFTSTSTRKTYGDTLTGAGLYTITGFRPGVANAYLADTAANVFSGTPTVTSAGFTERASVAGGPYAINIGNGSLASLNGYQFAFDNVGQVTIDPKNLTGTLATTTKTYDGTTDGSGTVSLDGVVGGDAVGASGTFTFVDRNAGVGKQVTVSGVTLSGADAGNYTLSVPAATIGDILQRAISVDGTVVTKTYDGTTDGSGTITLTGVVAGDDLDATGTFTFADKNAGTDKTVTLSDVSLTGADAGNYTLTVPASLLGDILQRAISGTVTVATKTYDGTTAATGTVALDGVIAGDDVGGAATFTFSDKHAGTGKTVTVSGATLSGADAANYTVTLPATALGDILRRAITGTATVATKTYDGTTAGTGSIGLAGVLAGDDVDAGATFTFSDRNAGTGKTVTVSGATLAGADAGNYTLTVPSSVLGDILQKVIDGTALVDAKTYDGTTAGTGTITLAGLVAGDEVTAHGTYTFSDANAGTGKTVTVDGVALTGADAGNYTVVVPGSTVADILRRAITVAADPASKPQGSADPALTHGITEGSLVAGDTLSGALARDAGEAPGTYAIGQGTLSATANYELTFVGSTLTITPVDTSPTDGLALNDDLGSIVRHLEATDPTAGTDAEPLRIVDERTRCNGAGRQDDGECNAGRPD